MWSIVGREYNRSVVGNSLSDDLDVLLIRLALEAKPHSIGIWRTKVRVVFVHSLFKICHFFFLAFSMSW